MGFLGRMATWSYGQRSVEEVFDRTYLQPEGRFLCRKGVFTLRRAE